MSNEKLFHRVCLEHLMQFCLWSLNIAVLKLSNLRDFFPCRYYPYHYAPYLSDIRNIGELKMKFELGKPFMPFEQLLAVLPAASKDLLPKCYQVGFRIKLHLSIVYCLSVLFWSSSLLDIFVCPLNYVLPPNLGVRWNTSYYS